MEVAITPCSVRRVWEIMKKYPETVDSNEALCMRVWREDYDKIPYETKLSYSLDFCAIFVAGLLTPMDTITRASRKVKEHAEKGTPLLGDVPDKSLIGSKRLAKLANVKKVQKQIRELA
jgi:hypothetical protein